MWKLLPLLLLVCLGAAGSAESSKGAQEEKLRAMVSNCLLDTRWCTTKNGKMSEEYQDTYSIQSATRKGKEQWTINVLVEVLGRNVAVPIPVRLSWAGETPVVTLEKVSVPGLGSYSARVLLYENTYAGVWSANGRAGMLHGTIQKPAATRPGGK